MECLLGLEAASFLTVRHKHTHSSRELGVVASAARARAVLIVVIYITSNLKLGVSILSGL